MSNKKLSGVGAVMFEALLTIGRKTKKAGQATTEELAAIAGISVKDAYSRLWWMEQKDGHLMSLGGKGKTKLWRIAPRKKMSAQAASEVSE